MLERRTAPQTLAWFLDLHHAKQLDLDPPYQRLSVWNLSYRQYFIDTVLRNYPSPAVFLDVETSGPGKTIYHVVDGKQRLTAITDFISDKFSTSIEYSGVELGGKYFSDLSQEKQSQFIRYVIPVEFLENANEVELIGAFDRLNRNVAKLNAQELRHAKYSGEFISLMETLADDPFWTDIGLATRARIRRMLDIEYVSEIFILTMHGVQEGKEILDQVYANYDEEIPDVDLHRRRYENCKSLIHDLWPNLKTERFKNLADFYSLWAAVLNALDAQVKLDLQATAERLSVFAESVRRDEKSAE